MCIGLPTSRGLKKDCLVQQRIFFFHFVGPFYIPGREKLNEESKCNIKEQKGLQSKVRVQANRYV